MKSNFLKIRESEKKRILEMHSSEISNEDMQSSRYTDSVEIKDKTASEVKSALDKIDWSKIYFLTILDSEYADFSDIDLCEVPNLIIVRVSQTKNNFKETQKKCYDELIHFSDDWFAVSFEWEE